MHIESSAPTRIDFAGGTLDIWPLYLFHERAQTLNAAISLRARCSIRPRDASGLSIVSGDTGRRVDVTNWRELKDSHELKLLGRLLHYFQADGLEHGAQVVVGIEDVGHEIRGSVSKSQAAQRARPGRVVREATPDKKNREGRVIDQCGDSAMVFSYDA